MATTGDDVITGTSGNDIIDALEGNDTIYGLAGTDNLYGWDGDDLIDGGEGDDWIFGEGGIDILIGGPGNDIFGEFDQWRIGDTITDFSIGDILLIRDADIATFTFSLDGTQLTYGGAKTASFTGGTMTLSGVAGAVLTASAWFEGGVQITMTAAPPPSANDQSLTGTESSDILEGNAGNDLIIGLGGQDQLSGAGGSDKLFGGSGDDTLSGDGAISFDNGLTVDELYGGVGNDMIFSGFGDIVDGGEGFDTVGLSYVGASAGIIGDTAILKQGQPLVPGGGTFVSVERFSDIAMTQFDDKMVIGDQDEPATVRSWDGDDHLIGQEVSITMYGGNGHDLLVGGRADDILYGQSGDDRLIGFFGADDMWGGEGADRFIFVNNDTNDRILDFVPGTDKIDLADIDADVTMPGDQGFTFIGTESFNRKAGQLAGYYENGTYFLVGDVDGDDTPELIIQVPITLGGSQPTISDLLL